MSSGAIKYGKDIEVEYAKYLDSCKHVRDGGKSLTLEEYADYLDKMRSVIGELINSDPGDQRSDIGRRIFRHLQGDVRTAIAFSCVSRGLKERSTRYWFVSRGHEFILKYIQRGTGYKNYLKENGIEDFSYSLAGLSGIAFTVISSVRAGVHYRRIPADAPRKTVTTTDEYGHKDTYTYIDHPEATAARAWTTGAVVTGLATGTGLIYRGIKNALEGIELTTFFTKTEKELLLDPSIKEPNFLQKMFSPGFRKWRLKMMRDNLSSNPQGWEDDPAFSEFICPLSLDFMLFPVKDKCGHFFDYRSVRASQLDPSNSEPLRCPASGNPVGWSLIKFDKAKFDHIQRLLWERKHPKPAPDALSSSESSDSSSESEITICSIEASGDSSSGDEGAKESDSSPTGSMQDSSSSCQRRKTKKKITLESIGQMNLLELCEYPDQKSVREVLREIHSDLLETYDGLLAEYRKKCDEYAEKEAKILFKYETEINEQVKPLQEKMEREEAQIRDKYSRAMDYSSGKSEELAREQDKQLATEELQISLERIELLKKQKNQVLEKLQAEKEIGLLRCKNDRDRSITNANFYVWQPQLGKYLSAISSAEGSFENL